MLVGVLFDRSRYVHIWMQQNDELGVSSSDEEHNEMENNELSRPP